MTDTPVLTTARLRLRPLVVEDADALHPVFADVELMTWWSSAPHASVAETRAYLAPRIGHDNWRCWAITLNGNDRAIGWVAAGEKRQGGVTEIGYILGRQHWGEGIAQ